MKNKYFAIIKRLGGAALIVLLAGLGFGALSSTFPEETRSSVLIHAIPFVGVFVAIILTFILSIFLVAMRLNGKIPQRTYRPIETIVIVGIGVGVVCLFQPWHQIAYNFGFLLLLGATLGFIMWSHVVPRSARLSAKLPPLETKAHLIGAAAGLIAFALVFGTFNSTAQPGEPYGMRQRQWDSLSDEQKAEKASEAQGQYVQIVLPFLIAISLFPGTILYFAVREVAAGAEQPAVATAAAAPARAG